MVALLTLDKVHNPLRLPHKTTSEPPKVVREWCALYILTSKCASRMFTPRRRALFSTSQLPKVVRTWRVLRIYLDMCFAPQRHAMFRPLHFQKCSECEVYFSFFTWKCVSRRNSVQFFITYLTAWLRTRSLSEPPFRPSGATNKV